MRMTALTLSVVVCCSTVRGEERGTLIFEDDFERNESQETNDKIGKGWKINGKNRAEGKNRVDLKNGALHIYGQAAVFHTVSATPDMEFQDGTVELRFKLERDWDILLLDFTDVESKEAHARRHFRVVIGTAIVGIADSDLSPTKWEHTKSPPSEQRKLRASKKKMFPVLPQANKWHYLFVEFTGDTVSVAIDGKNLGAFSSEGFADPTKRTFCLTVPHEAVVDDVKIYSQSPTTKN